MTFSYRGPQLQGKAGGSRAGTLSSRTELGSGVPGTKPWAPVGFAQPDQDSREEVAAWGCPAGFHIERLLSEPERRGTPQHSIGRDRRVSASSRPARFIH